MSDDRLDVLLGSSAPVIQSVQAGGVDVDALTERLRDGAIDVVEWHATGEPGDAIQLLRLIFERIVRDEMYSANWDALEERLTDRARESEPGVALIIRNASAFEKSDREQWLTAMQVLQVAGDDWRRTGKAFRVFAVTERPVA